MFVCLKIIRSIHARARSVCVTDSSMSGTDLDDCLLANGFNAVSKKIKIPDRQKICGVRSRRYPCVRTGQSMTFYTPLDDPTPDRACRFFAQAKTIRKRTVCTCPPLVCHWRARARSVCRRTGCAYRVERRTHQNRNRRPSDGCLSAYVYLYTEDERRARAKVGGRRNDWMEIVLIIIIIIIIDSKRSNDSETVSILRVHCI